MLTSQGISSPKPPRRATVRYDDIVVVAYREHHQALYRYLQRATHDHGVAEDFMQETFLRLLTEVRAGRTPVCIGAWLRRVASNLAISRGRRIAVAQAWMARCGAEAERAGSVESPEEAIIRQERAAELGAVVATIPEIARKALLLSGDGFSGPEIAMAIGRSQVATRTFICRSRAQTRERLAIADAL